MAITPAPRRRSAARPPRPVRPLHRLGAFLIVVGLSLAIMPTLARGADLDGINNDPTSPVTLRWGGPTTNLTWNGRTYTTAEGSFIGHPVAVPGDRASRTAYVRNDGPADATAVVRLTVGSVVTTGPDPTVNTELMDLVHLTWDLNGHNGDATWTDFASGAQPSYTARFPLARGQEFPVTLGYYFPHEATTGMADEHPSAVLDLTVEVTLEGDVPPLPTTGAQVSVQQLIWAGLFVGTGLVLLIVARRSRSDDDNLPARPFV